MEVFPLSGLDTALLEKIITKMDGKSYFILQQTCRTMKDLIQKSDNISVYVDCGILLEYGESSCQFHFHPMTRLWKDRQKWFKKAFDMEALYGTRWRSIGTPGGCHSFFRDRAATECQPLCDALKNNRITCDWLNIEISKFTTEECVTLLNIVNPKKVHLYSYGSKRYEALLQFKTLEDVCVRVDPQDGVIAATKFLPLFPKLEVRMYERLLFGKDKYDVFDEILKILFSNQFPNLRHFKFAVWGKQFDIPYASDLETIFHNYVLRGERIDEWANRVHIENVPQSGATCNIEFHEGGQTGSILTYDVKDV